MNLHDGDVASDPYLDLALDGLQLIEASAGTGKTFTLATLVTRLVIERDLRVGQILAVTFTEAATQELRERLRERLSLAARIATALATDPAAYADGGNAEIALTCQLILRQMQHESAAVLRARLQQAEREIDLAAVFTIHGFCARALAEHALETGEAFDPPEMIGSDRQLHDELAADLWRAFGADALDAELLQSLWSGPDALAKDLGALLGATRLQPEASDETPDPLSELQRAADALRTAFAGHGDDLRSQLETAIAGKVIHGGTYKATLPDELWRALHVWCAHGDASREIDPRIDRLTPTKLVEKTNKGRHNATPSSPLCDAVASYLLAIAQRREWLSARSLTLLHRVRSDAAQRLARLKHTRRLQTYDDLIDGVAVALDSAHGGALAANLRRQYAVALVDEFQDTDARQWAIFRRVFASGSDDALFLIGDPKQAIYRFRGGDVHTYLAAKRDAVSAPQLVQNFRSRPALLRAVAALYRHAGEAAFIDERIRFHKVEAGAGIIDADYQHNGKNAAALTVRVLPGADDGKPWKVDDSRALATAACVAEIHALLSEARAGRANIDGKPVQPGDIAVLVREHKEATRMQSALVAAGIAAVAAGKQSLFGTAEAVELLALFEALLRPGDEGRLRAALATMLLGVDAAGIARMDGDGDWRRDVQLKALAWRDRWQRHGPLALVADLCAANAERLLGLVDGERRLTNLLQLGEALQDADRRALGLHGLVDWLRKSIAEADPDDEQQLLRLESDARRVQIVTLHKSKGLEYPLVFLPFVGIGKDARVGRHCDVPDVDGRTLHWHAGGDAHAQAWQDACQTWELEQRAEDARLLYVGLTRAQHALWLATGPLYRNDETALAPMLTDLAALRRHADIVVDEGAIASALVPLPQENAGKVPDARVVERVLSRDWWVYSFTQLSNADAGDVGAATAAVSSERGAADEPEPLPASADSPIDRRFSGSRFGNVLHDALEHVDFAIWRDWCGDVAPEGQGAALHAALRAEGYADAELDDGIAALTPLVGHTLTVALPEGGRLCDLSTDARRAELEFHFALQPTSVDALLATLHAHGVLRERQAFGARRRIEGLMTGKIDLTYTTGGRYYLLDYKSSRLPDYDSDSLAQAMAHSEYDLQALIYTVALHRWLRFRLGDGYDYARDFGGVRYLFCRGLDAGADDARGIHVWTPAVELVAALDALFAGGGA
ncbi:MAG TPA: exodeoxyribonuclease V subunit beta [Luteimonas sp.]|nr:exodeoxyribonuclease V subunit beta [Luteimonas sp.]